MTDPAAQRPRRRGIWVVLAIATALLLVVPVCVQLWGQAITRTSTRTDVHPRPVAEVQIDAGEARVSVGPGRDGQVRVHQRLRWALDRPRVLQSWAGNVLIIKFQCDGDSGLYGDMECGGDLDVQVPPAVTLQASADSGVVNVRGLTGDLRLRADSGAVHVADVRGRLWAEVDSGEIRGTGLACAQAQTKVDSGSLRLDFAEPPTRLEAKAGSGSVKIAVPPGSYYRVNGWTKSGPAHIDRALNDRSSPREMELRSGSGPISVGYGSSG